MEPCPVDWLVRILYVKFVVPEYPPNVLSTLLIVVVASTVVKKASGPTTTPKVELSPKAIGTKARVAAANARIELRFMCFCPLLFLNLKCTDGKSDLR
jgi:hypothetical protein